VPTALPLTLGGFSAAICEPLHKCNRYRLLLMVHCLDPLIASKTPPARKRWGFLRLRKTDYAGAPITSYLKVAPSGSFSSNHVSAASTVEKTLI
jgi:hypothetical protein